MSLKIPQQSKFFYQSKWNAEMDVAFLIAIIQLKADGNWKATRIPTDALHSAEVAVNENFGTCLSWNDVYDRFKLLETRYHTFKEVINVPETHWDLRMNCIIAVDEVWKEIFKKNKFAKAYYHRGEPEFEKLANLFGSDDIKIESENTVIIISDTTIPIVDQQNEIITLSDSEEVTSPMPTHFKKLRRKLFDDGPHPMDLESTNNKGTHYYDAFPPRTRNHDTKPNKVPDSSSCASSSPSKWWTNPFM